MRLVIPDMYGYKNVKWLNAINVVQYAQDGYWENLGYDRDAVGGPLEGLLAATSRRFSPARSASCTGRTRSAFSSCSGRG